MVNEVLWAPLGSKGEFILSWKQQHLLSDVGLSLSVLYQYYKVFALAKAVSKNVKFTEIWIKIATLAYGGAKIKFGLSLRILSSGDLNFM